MSNKDSIRCRTKIAIIIIFEIRLLYPETKIALKLILASTFD